MIIRKRETEKILLQNCMYVERMRGAIFALVLKRAQWKASNRNRSAVVASNLTKKHKYSYYEVLRPCQRVCG